MKRADYLKLTPKQIELIEKDAADELAKDARFTDVQWGLLTMLLGSYQGDMDISFKDWVFGEME